jgi:copper oxidase (laccase) domain-containing protein
VANAEGVAACSSTRIGGVSLPYDSLNLGAHCGDNLQHVEENRGGCLPPAAAVKPVWLEQVHGKDVLKLTASPMRLNARMPLTAIRRDRLCGDDR